MGKSDGETRGWGGGGTVPPGARGRTFLPVVGGPKKKKQRHQAVSTVRVPLPVQLRREEEGRTSGETAMEWIVKRLIESVAGGQTSLARCRRVAHVDAKSWECETRHVEGANCNGAWSGQSWQWRTEADDAFAGCLPSGKFRPAQEVEVCSGPSISRLLLCSALARADEL